MWGCALPCRAAAWAVVLCCAVPHATAFSRKLYAFGTRPMQMALGSVAVITCPPDLHAAEKRARVNRW